MPLSLSLSLPLLTGERRRVGGAAGEGKGRRRRRKRRTPREQRSHRYCVKSSKRSFERPSFSERNTPDGTAQ
jgi:hypothetical protein